MRPPSRVFRLLRAMEEGIWEVTQFNLSHGWKPPPQPPACTALAGEALGTSVSLPLPLLSEAQRTGLVLPLCDKQDRCRFTSLYTFRALSRENIKL